jgi:hypothetical protein
VHEKIEILESEAKKLSKTFLTGLIIKSLVTLIWIMLLQKIALRLRKICTSFKNMGLAKKAVTDFDCFENLH